MTDIEKAKKLTHCFYVLQRQHKHEHTHEHIRRRDIMALEAVTQIMRKQGDGLIKMSALSDYFNVTPAAVSQMVREYERKGWIERVVLEHDRRSVYLNVTKEAKALIKRNEEACMKDIVDFISYLGEEDSDAFIRILEKAMEYGPLMKHHMKEE